jgi:hypothetical protein
LRMDYLKALFSEDPSASSTRLALVISHIFAGALALYGLHLKADAWELIGLILALLAPVDALKAIQKFSEVERKCGHE